jgi:hypothetical protein
MDFKQTEETAEFCFITYKQSELFPLLTEVPVIDKFLMREIVYCIEEDNELRLAKAIQPLKNLGDFNFESIKDPLLG